MSCYSQFSPDAQLFDRKFVDAVLNEWQKTMMDLPPGFRQAYELVNCATQLSRLVGLFLCLTVVSASSRD